MNTSQFHLVIHPFVYFKVLNNSYLFINTLNNITIKGNSKTIIGFLNTVCYQLPNYNNIYHYKGNELLEDEVHLFLDKITDLNIGVIINSNPDKNPPIAVSSEINIKRTEMLKYSDILRKENLLKLNLFINSFNDKKLVSHYKQAYKQFLFPYVDLKKKINLNAEKVFVFAKSAQSSNLKNLNFIFGDLSCVLDYQKHINYFKDFNVSIYSVVEDTIKNLENLEKLHVQFPTLKYKVLTTLNSQKSKKIQEQIGGISESEIGESITFEFIIESEDEFNFLSDEILSKYPKLNYLIKPFYTGNNYDFFKENIFYNESDILESVGTMRETLAKTKLNSLNFGQLNVLPNGQILTNSNSKSIGNIYTNSLDEATYNAHFDKSSTWFQKRSDITPCQDCLYCDLCPSIGNYEFVLNKYNLCSI